ncbi:sulfite exporter TauE/SafE family protein [Oricola cellulosilytica]|uniref:Probable membrane transporter protein n=1 Tax=Oricola cellulosilytica TaxID=1429082 RepID=A0A4R0PEM4_9HYPH|nr:sulfite exporter TauE/SafE family protein [Oricola cellulosilytica]TCD13823.1 sulfite exporter TauE/SafE family protein [Oricola cellulosilytica]
MTVEILVFLAAGLVGGAVNAAAGGAKIFVFPMLLATGLPPIAANVTQGVALWPAQLPAVWVYRREVAGELRKLFRQMLPALAGALAGAIVMVNASNEAFVTVVPVLLVLAVGAIILGPRTTALMRWAFPGDRLKAATAVLLAVFGFYGGFFGAGLGFMLLAVLSASSGAGVSHVNGAKNLFAASIQSVAVVPMMMSGLVDWVAALCVLTGGIFGGYIGASITRRLPEAVVRTGVAGLGLVLTMSFLLS